MKLIDMIQIDGVTIKYLEDEDGKGYRYLSVDNKVFTLNDRKVSQLYGFFSQIFNEFDKSEIKWKYLIVSYLY